MPKQIFRWALCAFTLIASSGTTFAGSKEDFLRNALPDFDFPPKAAWWIIAAQRATSDCGYEINMDSIESQSKILRQFETTKHFLDRDIQLGRDTNPIKEAWMAWVKEDKVSACSYIHDEWGRLDRLWLF